MRKDTRPSLTLKFFVAVSLLGSFIALFIIVYSSAMEEDFLWRKPLVGSIFTLICTGGSIVALSPRKCSEALNTHPESVRASHDKSEFALNSKGHHPDCGRFSRHTIQFGGVFYCSACTGLLAGAAIALAVSLPFFFFGLGISPIGLPIVLVAQLGLVLGFVQFRFKGWVRLAANAFFVVGGSLMLIGIDQYLASLLVDLYLIGLITFWILTRIMISQWDHFRICATCDSSCKNERKDGGSTSSTQAV